MGGLCGHVDQWRSWGWSGDDVVLIGEGEEDVVLKLSTLNREGEGDVYCIVIIHVWL